MRYAIAYIVSAAAHVLVVALLLPGSSSKEDTSLDSLEQLTIDLEILAPLSKTEPELKPVVAKAIKPTQKKKIYKKVNKPVPIPEKKPSPQTSPEKPPESFKTDTALPNSQEEKEASLAVSKSQQSMAEPIKTTAPKPKIVDTKQSVKDDNKSFIIHNPAYRSKRPIKYPKRAKRKKLQGTVIIRATIDSYGRVKKSWVHKSSGHSILDSSAMKSIQSWIFTPAQQDGLAIESTVQFPVAFQLK